MSKKIFVSLSIFCIFLTGCSMERTSQTLDASGNIIYEVKCNYSPNECLQTANKNCPSGFDTLYSDSHAGGTAADFIPGPVTWYDLKYSCSSSPGKQPDFAWTGMGDLTPFAEAIGEAVGQAYSPNTNSASNYTPNRANRCTSDSSCRTGEICVKGPGKTSGQCMKSVNKYGIQTYTRSGSGAKSCTTRSDCPVGFQCDRVLKACVKN